MIILFFLFVFEVALMLSYLILLFSKAASLARSGNLSVAVLPSGFLTAAIPIRLAAGLVMGFKGFLVMSYLPYFGLMRALIAPYNFNLA